MNENTKEDEAASQRTDTQQAGVDAVERATERFRICPVSYVLQRPFITVKAINHFLL